VLLRLVFVNFCLTVAIRAMSTFLPVLLAEAGMPVTRIGVIFTVMLTVGAGASILAASLSKRTGGRLLIQATLLGGLPFAAAGLYLLPGAWGILLVVAAGTIMSSSMPLMLVFAQSYSGGSPAMASSLIMGVSWGLAGLAMVLLGWVGDLIGIRPMMLVSLAVPLLALVPALRLPRR
jgi:FSR family fosmidomycin resistance protein-like MFS transporter